MGNGGSSNNGRGGRSNGRAKRSGGSGSARSSSSQGTTIELTIPSDFSLARDVQERVLKAVEEHGFNEDSTFAIKLSLEEALINAIKHGNRQDPAKKVHILVKVKPGVIEMTLEDEGPGFDRCCVPDPTSEENIDKCSGRGILLMEAYMNSVSYSNGGRRVTLVRKNQLDAIVSST